MRNKMLTVLALVLFMSAFLLHTKAYASAPADNTVPTLTARLSGDTLHIEATDGDSGVEAVFIDGHKAAYPSEGALEIPLWDYAGTGQYVSVYAVDYAGNQSGTVQVENPYYKAWLNGAKNSETSESAVPAVPKQTIPFTPEGTGTTVDNAASSDGKEFFTITTPDENVFYLIIDRQRENENVYFLNAVTEDDLLSLAKKNGGNSGESAIPTPKPDSQAEVTPEPDAKPEAQPEKGGDSTLIFVLLAVVAAGGAGYYLKIYKPKHQAADTDEEESEYEEDTPLSDQTEDADDVLPSEEEFGEFTEDDPTGEDEE